jgi:hypothetical protein
MRSFLISIIAASGVIGASPAVATTATGNQNPDLTVTVSIASRGAPDPDSATVRDTVDALLSVRNNKSWTFGARVEKVRLRVTLGVPFEQFPSDSSLSLSFTVFLFPQQTLRLPFDYTVGDSLPKGLYSLTLEAFEVDDAAMPPASSATATLTIF